MLKVISNFFLVGLLIITVAVLSGATKGTSDEFSVAQNRHSYVVPRGVVSFYIYDLEKVIVANQEEQPRVERSFSPDNKNMLWHITIDWGAMDNTEIGYVEIQSLQVDPANYKNSSATRPLELSIDKEGNFHR